MIFFGTRAKTIPGKPIEGIECPNCGHKQFVASGILRYFHLYWIPTLVTSKTVVIECNHCRRGLIDKELPKELLKELKPIIFRKRNIIPMFTGSIIIAFFVLSIIYAGKQQDIKEASYLEKPAINDLYIINIPKMSKGSDLSHPYGLMRVHHLSATQVEFQISKLAYNKASGVEEDIRNMKTSLDEYYTDEALKIDISELQKMKDTNAIYSVKRF